MSYFNKMTNGPNAAMTLSPALKCNCRKQVAEQGRRAGHCGVLWRARELLRKSPPMRLQGGEGGAFHFTSFPSALCLLRLLPLSCHLPGRSLQSCPEQPPCKSTCGLGAGKLQGSRWKGRDWLALCSHPSFLAAWWLWLLLL